MNSRLSEVEARIQAKNPKVSFVPGQEYRGNKLKYRFVCLEHGEFETTAQNILVSAKACPKCSKSSKFIVKLTEEEALKRLSSKFPKFKFRMHTTYETNVSKVVYTCDAHGEAEAVYSYLAGLKQDTPCRKCNFLASDRRKWLPFSTFVGKSSVAHHNKYSYVEASYAGTNQKITVVCPEHGEFAVNAHSHMSGVGCQKCYVDSRTGVSPISSEEFEAKARKVHGKRYQYDLSTFKGMTNYVDILCSMHGKFSQKASYHVDAKAGCPTCGKIISKGR